MTSPPPFDSSREIRIGVFGGSGFYALFESALDTVAVHTPYGAPSDSVTIGTIADVPVAFIPRHGRQHIFPPHQINYRANLWAMSQLGVTRILGPNAAGSLQPSVRPGDFVICDQFVDRTTGRAATFYDGPRVVHISTADPYCPELRMQAASSARDLGIEVHESGTVVVIQGPRFSTRAESHWFSRQGWQVVNMTQYPEVALARELGMCYVNISLITDFDAGLDQEEGVEVTDILQVMAANNDRLRALIQRLVPRIPVQRSCSCADALSNAVVG